MIPWRTIIRRFARTCLWIYGVAMVGTSFAMSQWGGMAAGGGVLLLVTLLRATERDNNGPIATSVPTTCRDGLSSAATTAPSRQVVAGDEAAP